MRYLSAPQIVFLHSRLIDELGGKPGVRDIRKLVGALAGPREQFFGRPVDRYREEKAAALMHALIQRRPFHSLNRVTALAAALLFLQRNGALVECDSSQAVGLLDGVEKGRLAVRELGRWLRAHRRGGRAG